MEFSTLNGYKVKDKKAIRYYDTVADMKADTTLKNGMHVKTKGYYSANDGGSAEYFIINDNTLVDDSGSVHGLTNGLRAKLIIDNEINPNQFGAYGDGIHDDTNKLNNAIIFAKNNNFKLTSLKNKTYLISSPLDLSNLYVDFNYATIKATDDINMILIDSTNYYTNLEHITIDMNNIANYGIYIKEGRKCFINNIDLINVTNTGIYFESGYELYLDTINITGNENSTESIGIYLGSSDSYCNNIITIDMHTAIYQTNNTLIFYDNIHSWLISPNLVDGSAMFKFNTSLKAIINNCYSDTYLYTFYQVGTGTPRINVNNLVVLYASYVMTSELMNDKIPHLIYNEAELGDALTCINNIQFNGLSTISSNSKLTNHEYFNGKITNAIMTKINKSHGYSSISNYNRDNTVTVVSEKLEKVGNIVHMESMYQVDATTTKTFNLGTIPYYFRPSDNINTFLTYGPEYQPNNIGYLYITASNGGMTTTLPSEATGTVKIKINVTYFMSNLQN